MLVLQHVLAHQGPTSASPCRTYSVQLGKLNSCPGGKVLQCHQLLVAMHSQYNCGSLHNLFDG